MNEKLYEVLKSNRYGNLLAFNIKTSEYVYFHFGEEVWREKADRKLFDVANEMRINNNLDLDELGKFEIYKKYSKSTEEISKKEMEKLFEKYNLKGKTLKQVF